MASSDEIENCFPRASLHTFDYLSQVGVPLRELGLNIILGAGSEHKSSSWFGLYSDLLELSPNLSLFISSK